MANQKLETILHDVYGVGVCAADPVCVIWAADRIEDTAHAKREIKRVNRLRSKYGHCPVYVPFGHRLF